MVRRPVSWASYHEQWLLEAIANYSALMLLEQRHPTEEQVMLQAYRQLLASKSKDGLPNVEAGPVSLGIRLSSSKFPVGYEIITYGRGTWLMHMLREMFRDASRTSENPDGSDQVFLTLLRGCMSATSGRKSPTPTSSGRSRKCSRSHSGSRTVNRWIGSLTDGSTARRFPRFDIKDARFSTRTGKPVVTATLHQTDAPDDLVTSIPVYGWWATARSIWAACSPRDKRRALVCRCLQA